MVEVKHKGYVSGVGVKAGTHYIQFKDGTTINFPKDKEILVTVV